MIYMYAFRRVNLVKGNIGFDWLGLSSKTATNARCRITGIITLTIQCYSQTFQVFVRHWRRISCGAKSGAQVTFFCEEQLEVVSKCCNWAKELLLLSAGGNFFYDLFWQKVSAKQHSFTWPTRLKNCAAMKRNFLGNKNTFWWLEKICLNPQSVT